MNNEELVQQTLRSVFNDENIIFDKSHFAGGITNYNYIMEIQGVKYVIREPGLMTERIINRQVEQVNNNIASELDINSKCIYFDPISGIKISVYINNSINLALDNPGLSHNLEAVSLLLKKIHTSKKPFPNVFDWHLELEKYEKVVEQLNGLLFSDYIMLKELLLNFMDEHIKNTIFVPCHNDTVPENFLLDKEGKYYLIDWEYSGMNDPAWDVTSYIIESQLPKEAIDLFLFAYYGQNMTVEDELKIKGYLMVQDLLWTVWALIRHYSGEDFRDYCSKRYDRFRKNIKAISKSKEYSISEMVNP